MLYNQTKLVWNTKVYFHIFLGRSGDESQDEGPPLHSPVSKTERKKDKESFTHKKVEEERDILASATEDEETRTGKVMVVIF